MFHTQIPLLFNGISVLNPPRRYIEKFGHLVHSPNAVIIGKEARCFLCRNWELPRGLVDLTRYPSPSILANECSACWGHQGKGLHVCASAEQ